MSDLIVLEAGWNIEVAAATAETAYLCNPLPVSVEPVSAYLLPAGATTANDTNYTTLSLKKAAVDAVTAVTTETSGSGGTGNLVAGTSIALTVVGATLAPGESLIFAKAETASGAAFTGKVVCAFRPIRSV